MRILPPAGARGALCRMAEDTESSALTPAMKLHLPTGLRKALLACLAAVAIPSAAVPTTIASASGFAALSFLAASQRADAEEPAGPGGATYANEQQYTDNVEISGSEDTVLTIGSDSVTDEQGKLHVTGGGEDIDLKITAESTDDVYILDNNAGGFDNFGSIWLSRGKYAIYSDANRYAINATLKDLWVVGDDAHLTFERYGSGEQGYYGEEHKLGANFTIGRTSTDIDDSSVGNAFNLKLAAGIKVETTGNLVIQDSFGYICLSGSDGTNAAAKLSFDGTISGSTLRLDDGDASQVNVAGELYLGRGGQLTGALQLFDQATVVLGNDSTLQVGCFNSTWTSGIITTRDGETATLEITKGNGNTAGRLNTGAGITVKMNAVEPGAKQVLTGKDSENGDAPSVLAGDVLVVAGTLELQGTDSGYTIGGKVTIEGGKLVFDKDTTVSGGITYNTESSGGFDYAAGITVTGDWDIRKGTEASRLTFGARKITLVGDITLSENAIVQFGSSGGQAPVIKGKITDAPESYGQVWVENVGATFEDDVELKGALRFGWGGSINIKTKVEAGSLLLDNGNLGTSFARAQDAANDVVYVILSLSEEEGHLSQLGANNDSPLSTIDVNTHTLDFNCVRGNNNFLNLFGKGVAFGVKGDGKKLVLHGGGTTGGGLFIDQGASLQLDGAAFTITEKVSGGGKLIIATEGQANDTWVTLTGGGALTGALEISIYGGQVSLGANLEIGGLERTDINSGRAGQFKSSDSGTKTLTINNEEDHVAAGIWLGSSKSDAVDLVKLGNGKQTLQGNSNADDFNSVHLFGNVTVKEGMLKLAKKEGVSSTVVIEGDVTVENAELSDHVVTSGLSIETATTIGGELNVTGDFALYNELTLSGGGEISGTFDVAWAGSHLVLGNDLVVGNLGRGTAETNTSGRQRVISRASESGPSVYILFSEESGLNFNALNAMYTAFAPSNSERIEDGVGYGIAGKASGSNVTLNLGEKNDTEYDFKIHGAKVTLSNSTSFVVGTTTSKKTLELVGSTLVLGDHTLFAGMLRVGGSSDTVISLNMGSQTEGVLTLTGVEFFDNAGSLTIQLADFENGQEHEDFRLFSGETSWLSGDLIRKFKFVDSAGAVVTYVTLGADGMLTWGSDLYWGSGSAGASVVLGSDGGSQWGTSHDMTETGPWRDNADVHLEAESGTVAVTLSGTGSVPVNSLQFAAASAGSGSGATYNVTVESGQILDIGDALIIGKGTTVNFIINRINNSVLGLVNAANTTVDGTLVIGGQGKKNFGKVTINSTGIVDVTNTWFTDGDGITDQFSGKGTLKLSDTSVGDVASFFRKYVSTDEDASLGTFEIGGAGLYLNFVSGVATPGNLQALQHVERLKVTPGTAVVLDDNSSDIAGLASLTLLLSGDGISGNQMRGGAFTFYTHDTFNSSSSQTTTVALRWGIELSAGASIQTGRQSGDNAKAHVLQLEGTLTNAGGFTLTKKGVGVLELTGGFNTSGGGGTIDVAAGSLKLSYSTNSGALGEYTVRLESGTTLESSITGTIKALTGEGALNVTSGKLTLGTASGSSLINLQLAASAGLEVRGGSFTIAGEWTWGAGSTLTLGAKDQKITLSNITALGAGDASHKLTIHLADAFLAGANEAEGVQLFSGFQRGWERYFDVVTDGEGSYSDIQITEDGKVMWGSAVKGGEAYWGGKQEEQTELTWGGTDGDEFDDTKEGTGSRQEWNNNGRMDVTFQTGAEAASRTVHLGEDILAKDLTVEGGGSYSFDSSEEGTKRALEVKGNLSAESGSLAFSEDVQLSVQGDVNLGASGTLTLYSDMVFGGSLTGAKDSVKNGYRKSSVGTYALTAAAADGPITHSLWDNGMTPENTWDEFLGHFGSSLGEGVGYGVNMSQMDFTISGAVTLDRSFEAQGAGHKLTFSGTVTVGSDGGLVVGDNVEIEVGGLVKDAAAESVNVTYQWNHEGEPTGSGTLTLRVPESASLFNGAGMVFGESVILHIVGPNGSGEWGAAQDLSVLGVLKLSGNEMVLHGNNTIQALDTTDLTGKFTLDNQHTSTTLCSETTITKTFDFRHGDLNMGKNKLTLQGGLFNQDRATTQPGTITGQDVELTGEGNYVWNGSLNLGGTLTLSAGSQTITGHSNEDPEEEDILTVGAVDVKGTATLTMSGENGADMKVNGNLSIATGSSFVWDGVSSESNAKGHALTVAGTTTLGGTLTFKGGDNTLTKQVTASGGGLNVEAGSLTLAGGLTGTLASLTLGDATSLTLGADATVTGSFTTQGACIITLGGNLSLSSFNFSSTVAEHGIVFESTDGLGKSKKITIQEEGNVELRVGHVYGESGSDSHAAVLFGEGTEVSWNGKSNANLSLSLDQKDFKGCRVEVVEGQLTLSGQLDKWRSGKTWITIQDIEIVGQSTADTLSIIGAFDSPTSRASVIHGNITMEGSNLLLSNTMVLDGFLRTSETTQVSFSQAGADLWYNGTSQYGWTLQEGGSIGAVTWNGPFDIYLGGTLTIHGGMLDASADSGAGNCQYAHSFLLYTGAAGQDVQIVDIVNKGQTVTSKSGLLVGEGLTFVKQGEGTQVFGKGSGALARATDIKGNLDVQEGTLLLNGDGAISGALSGAGTLQVGEGGTLSITGGGDMSGALEMLGGNLSVSGETLTVGAFKAGTTGTLTVQGELKIG